MGTTRRFGAAIALAGAVATLAIGCSDSVGVDGGRVRFVLSADAGQMSGGAALADAVTTDDDHGDRPRQFFQSANITLTSILARNQDGVLVNVTLDELPITVDVVMLDNGRQVSLPEGSLDPGTYDQVVLVMKQIEAVTLDGTIIAITPSGGGWTAVVPICPFAVEDGETTTVSLTFMLNQAFSWRTGRFHFEPRLTCGEG